MEGDAVFISSTLLAKPKKFLPKHFSLPKHSLTLGLIQKNLGTETKRTIIHNDGSIQKKKKKRSQPKPKNPPSNNAAAVRKRKSRANPKVRAAENARRIAAYAAKRDEKKLKEEEEKKEMEKNLMKVNTDETALTPFSASDECEGTYILEYKTVITEDVYVNHKWVPAQSADGKCLVLGGTLVNIDYSNDTEKARIISRL